MFKLKKKYRNKIKSNIDKYCLVNYEKLNKDSMELGEGLFNNRCQWNAVQQLEKGKFKEVYLCICMNDSEYPIVHFINKKDGKYVDNTLGFKYREYDYYIIRKIDSSELHKTNDILYDTKKLFIKMFSNGLLNKIFNVNENNLGI